MRQPIFRWPAAWSEPSRRAAAQPQVAGRLDDSIFMFAFSRGGDSVSYSDRTASDRHPERW